MTREHVNYSVNAKETTKTGSEKLKKIRETEKRSSKIVNVNSVT